MPKIRNLERNPIKCQHFSVKLRDKNKELERRFESTKTHHGLVWIVMGLLAFPALARAETTACDLLTKADVEDITGMQVTQTRLESLSLCAGFCETATGTRCIYIGTLEGVQHVVDLEVELPPYIKRDMIGLARGMMEEDKGRGAQTAEMQVLGFPAFWSFAGGYARLHILDGDEVHFSIGEDRVTQNDVALQHAEIMAARVYDRYRAQ